MSLGSSSVAAAAYKKALVGGVRAVLKMEAMGGEGVGGRRGGGDVTEEDRALVAEAFGGKVDGVDHDGEVSLGLRV